MEIAVVVGLITEDVFVSIPNRGTNAAVFRGYGGILHALSAFSASNTHTAVVSLSTDEALREIREIFDGRLLPDFQSVHTTRDALPRCCLCWAPGAREPVEHTTTHGKAIRIDAILSTLERVGARSVYVNFMLGHDVDVSTVIELAERGYRIFLDPHMFLYQRDRLGARFLEPPNGWESLFCAADYLQLNRPEFESILLKLGENPSESGAEDHLLTHLWDLGGRTLGLVITSSRRVVRCHRDGDNVSSRSWLVKTIRPSKRFFTIGCGDVFGAGIFRGLLEDWSLKGFDNGVEMGTMWARSAANVPGISRHFIEL